MELSLPTTVFSAFLGSTVLLMALIYISKTPGAPQGLSYWIIGIALNSVRYSVILWVLMTRQFSMIFIVEALQAVGAFFLVAGSLVFLGRRVWWNIFIGACIAAVAWAAFTTLVAPNFLLRSIPLYLASGCAVVWVGFSFIQARHTGEKSGYGLTGSLFIMWGIHKLDFPLLRPIEWFAPYGFMIATILFMSIAISLIVITQRRMLLVSEQEIRERHKAEAALRRSEESLRLSESRYRNLVKDIPDLLYRTDNQDRITYVSESVYALSGFTVDEAMGMKMAEEVYVDPATRDLLLAELQQNGQVTNFENQLIRKDGSIWWGSANAHLLKGDDGSILGVEGIVRDISEQKSAEEQLSYQASHDVLTGLINRHEFENRTSQLLSRIKYDDAEHAMCFMDLDQFKVVNDTCGHVAGDELLRQLGKLLQNTVSKRDTLARLGGDEFGVLMEHCSLEQAHRVGDEILKAVKNYQFFWEGEAFRIGVSIGLTAITEATSNFSELFKQADAACYLAKDHGRNRIHTYLPEDTELAIRHGEMQWVGRISQALDDSRFCLYAQPIVSLDNGAIKHYELLTRMLDEKGETIPPGAFLPAAERYNLIERLDTWVITNACTFLAEHPYFVEQMEFVSINLSGPSLVNKDLLETIMRNFREFGVSPDKFCFEITETVAISNLESATSFISILKQLGCRFALDDFGSGLSSFGYLKNLPVDYLKIDGMFVRDIVDDPIDHAMVKSINDIGQVMGMQTIAEFVENDEVKGLLKGIGVNYGQGYGLGKPRPLIDLV